MGAIIENHRKLIVLATRWLHLSAFMLFIDIVLNTNDNPKIYAFLNKTMPMKQMNSQS